MLPAGRIWLDRRSTSACGRLSLRVAGTSHRAQEQQREAERRRAVGEGAAVADAPRVRERLGLALALALGVGGERLLVARPVVLACLGDRGDIEPGRERGGAQAAERVELVLRR